MHAYIHYVQLSHVTQELDAASRSGPREPARAAVPRSAGRVGRERTASARMYAYRYIHSCSYSISNSYIYLSNYFFVCLFVCLFV